MVVSQPKNTNTYSVLNQQTRNKFQNSTTEVKFIKFTPVTITQNPY